MNLAYDYDDFDYYDLYEGHHRTEKLLPFDMFRGRAKRERVHIKILGMPIEHLEQNEFDEMLEETFFNMNSMEYELYDSMYEDQSEDFIPTLPKQIGHRKEVKQRDRHYANILERTAFSRSKRNFSRSRKVFKKARIKPDHKTFAAAADNFTVPPFDEMVNYWDWD